MRSMDFYSKAAMERAMKVQDVMLQAMAKKITWWQAAECHDVVLDPRDVANTPFNSHILGRRGFRRRGTRTRRKRRPRHPQARRRPQEIKKKTPNGCAGSKCNTRNQNRRQ